MCLWNTSAVQTCTSMYHDMGWFRQRVAVSLLTSVTIVNIQVAGASTMLYRQSPGIQLLQVFSRSVLQEVASVLPSCPGQQLLLQRPCHSLHVIRHQGVDPQLAAAPPGLLLVAALSALRSRPWAAWHCCNCRSMEVSLVKRFRRSTRQLVDAIDRQGEKPCEESIRLRKGGLTLQGWTLPVLNMEGLALEGLTQEGLTVEGLTPATRGLYTGKGAGERQESL